MARDPNTRLYHKNPFIRRALQERERRYQDKMDYGDFLSWLRTPDGQEFLEEQVHISGWLDTPDGQVWLDTEDGRNWRRTTQQGEDYQRLRSTREGRIEFRNPLSDLYEKQEKQELTSRTEQELTRESKQANALESFSGSGKSIFEIREEGVKGRPAGKLPTISTQGEAVVARRYRGGTSLDPMHPREIINKIRGKWGKTLPKPLTKGETERLFEGLERKESPYISQEKYLEYKKYMDSRTDENWQESPLGQEILEFITPHLPKGLRITSGVVKILSDWRDRPGIGHNQPPEDQLIEGEIDQSKWAEQPKKPSTELPTEGKDLVNARNYYNVEANRIFKGTEGPELKKTGWMQGQQQPVHDFFEYNAAKVQAIFDLIENIKAGNTMFEGPIGRQQLKIPPRGARYFTKRPIPKHGPSGPGSSELTVSTSYIQMRELLGNMFGMSTDDLDRGVYDYSLNGGSPVQIQWLLDMGLLERVNTRWVEKFHIDKDNKPTDWYLDTLGRPRLFPAGAPNGESLVLQPHFIFPPDGNIGYARRGILPSLAEVYFKKTTKERIGEYPTDRTLRSGRPAKGRPKFRQFTKIYKLESDYRITKPAKNAREGLVQAFFPDPTQENQEQFTRNVLQLIANSDEPSNVSNLKPLISLDPTKKEELSTLQEESSIKIESPIKSTPEQIRPTGSPKWQIPDKETFLRKVFQEYIADEQRLIEERREDRPKGMRRKAWAKELELKISPETYAERVQDKISQVRNLIGQSGGEVKGDFLDFISPEDIEFYWNSKEIMNKNTGRINIRNIDQLMQPIETTSISGVEIPVKPTKPILEVQEGSAEAVKELTHAENLKKIPAKAQIKRAFKKDTNVTRNISQLTHDNWRQILKYQSQGLSSVQAYQKFAASEVARSTSATPGARPTKPILEGGGQRPVAPPVDIQKITRGGGTGNIFRRSWLKLNMSEGGFVTR